MTARLDTTFSALRARGEGGFIPFFMLGDPDAERSQQLIEQGVRAGADMLELGLPFSDPPGDGPVVQAAGVRALAAGTTTARALAIVRAVSARYDVPISLLCYYNVVLQYGTDTFYRDAAAAGVDAVLVADVPLEESDPVVEAARRHGVAPVFMVSMLTSDARMERVAARAGGYLYAVAHVGVTGERDRMAAGVQDVVTRCRRYSALPVLAGFGLSTPDHVRQAIAAGADGAICGSALVRHMTEGGAPHDEALGRVDTFVRTMKSATKGAMKDATR